MQNYPNTRVAFAITLLQIIMANHHTLDKWKYDDNFKGMKKIPPADWQAIEEIEGACHLLSIYAKNE